MSDKPALLTYYDFVLVLVLFPALCFCGGIYQGKENAEYDAVEAGHAEFYLDDNASRKWRWKEKTKDDQ